MTPTLSVPFLTRGSSGTTYHSPKFWRNEAAFWNMSSMSVACDTFQEEISRLKEEAFWNM